MARTLRAADDDALERRAGGSSWAGPANWFADTLGASAQLVGVDVAVPSLSGAEQGAQIALVGDAGADQFVLPSASQAGRGDDAIAASAAFQGSGAATSFALDGGALDVGTFEADLAAAMSGVLGANDRIVFNPDAGSFAGHRFLIIDVDGIAGFTPGVDSVLMIGFL